MEDVNKKGFNYTILFIVVFAIASVIVLLFIWWPKGSTKAEKIKKYTAVTDGESKCVSIYMSKLKFLLNSDNSAELFKKVDPSYLQENNLNESNFKEFMDTNKFISKNPIFEGNTVTKQNNGVIIYRIEYLTYGGYKKYVNVLENKPYDYTVTFEQDKLPVGDKNFSSNTFDEVKYDVEISAIRENGLTYKLTVTNTGDKTVEYNFNSIDNVVLLLDDDTRIKMGAAVISSVDDILPPNSTFNKEFFFPIGSDYIQNVKSLIINNVKVDNEKKQITINLK